MIQRLKNINSVAHYEAKLLGRSWFFRIFGLLILAIGSIIVFTHEDNNIFGLSYMEGLFAYFICSPLNVVQSIVIIFLSADYLKRDKQLDTSEVFYVRPLSNAEYLIGKMWGTIRQFILLDIVLLTIFFFLGKYVVEVSCSPIDFVIYFGLIILPSLLFIVGVSTIVMLLIGNQAITFVVMLGLSALSLFYVGDMFYNLFDMFAMNLPMYGSGKIGFTNLDHILSHRILYMLFGLSSVFLSIFLFKRLAGTSVGRYKWLVVSLMFYGFSIYSGVEYYRESTITEREREVMMSLNNRYISYPRLLVESYDIDLEHLGGEIASTTSMSGTLSKEGSSVVFVLNSGMRIDSVKLLTGGEKSLSFEREKHLLVIDLDKKYSPSDTIKLSVKYQGNITSSELFVDVDSKIKNEEKNSAYAAVVKIDKKGAVIHPEWVVLTPESYWYPRSGVSYTDSTASWQKDYFSKYTLKVKPLEGMMPVSQGDGEMLSDSLSYRFTSSKPYRAITLAISDYERLSTKVDNVEYTAYIHKDNKSAIEPVEMLADTLPKLLKSMRGDIERMTKMKYELDRFTIVDVPAQIYSYKRTWSTTQEVLQPEIMLLPGAGFRERSFDFKREVDMMKYAVKRGWYYGIDKNASDTTIVANVFTSLKWTFNNKERTDDFSMGKMGQLNVTQKANPYYLSSVLFNSLYNVYSDDYSWGNNMIEQYAYLSRNSSWTRQLNGISTFEQLMLRLQESTPEEVMIDPKYAKLHDVAIESLGYILFAESMSKLGIEEFKALLNEEIAKTKFSNVSFETLLDTISKKSDTDINSKIELTKKMIEIPSFYVQPPEKHKYPGDKETTFVYKIILQNLSDVPGYVRLTYNGRETKEQIVMLEPNQAKEVVSHSPTEYYSFIVNTMNSKNLPQEIFMPFVTAITPSTMPEEGEHILDVKTLTDPNEIIVDNEDEELFSIEEPQISGYLNLWVEKSMENDFKYKGESGRVPTKWTPYSSERAYGNVVKSAYHVRPGDGDRKAIWRIPIKEKGRYSLYTIATYPYEIRWMRGRGGKKINSCYQFTIKNGDKEEDVMVDLANLSPRDFQSTWLWIGDVDAVGDEIVLTLYNKTDLYKVVADAVKAVKID